MRTITPWSEERVEQLRILDSEGLSAAEIARKLGGTTRNACIGIIRRRGFHLETPRAPRIKKAAAQKPFAFNRGPRSAPSLPDPPLCAVESLRLDMEQLTRHTCRYPEGHSPPYSYCGHPPVDGSPYCAAHKRLVHQPQHGPARTVKAE
jgi:GcrA cell cycle regulator